MQRRTTGWLTAGLGLAALILTGCDNSQDSGASAAGGPGASGQTAAGAAGQGTAGTAGQTAAGTGGQGSSGISGHNGGIGGSLDDPANYTGPITPVDTSTLDKAAYNSTCAHQIRLAQAAQEAAALYSDAGKVWLQRLSMAGQPDGDPIALGDAPTDGQLPGEVLPPHVSLASDATGYVACWDTGVTSLSLDQAQVSCARVAAGTGAVTALFTESGGRPSVARRSEGFALAIRRPELVTVRYLDPASTIAPFTMPVAAAQSSGSGQGASDLLLTSTASGFALVNLSSGQLLRLDPSLEPSGEPQSLTSDSWFTTTPHLVAVGDTIALGRTYPYQFRLSLAAPGQPLVQVSFKGGSKEGMNGALTVHAGSVGVFAPVSSLDGPALIFHAIDPAHPPTATIYPQKLESGGSWQNGWGDQCSFAAVPVEGATLVAIPALHGIEVVRFAQP